MAKPPYKRDDPSLSAIRAYKGAVITDERNTSLSDYAVADRDFAVTDETGDRGYTIPAVKPSERGRDRLPDGGVAPQEAEVYKVKAVNPTGNTKKTLYVRAATRAQAKRFVSSEHSRFVVDSALPRSPPAGRDVIDLVED